MPKMGIIMPLGIGFGISISLQTGVPAPTYFEIEAGFVGCASRIMVKEKTRRRPRSASRSITTGDRAGSRRWATSRGW
jgi:hypothetical protein